jgi:hypothetical protein
LLEETIFRVFSNKPSPHVFEHGVTDHSDHLHSGGTQGSVSHGPISSSTASPQLTWLALVESGFSALLATEVLDPLAHGDEDTLGGDGIAWLVE